MVKLGAGAALSALSLHQKLILLVRPKLDIDQPQRTGQLGVLCLSDEVLQKEYE